MMIVNGDISGVLPVLGGIFSALFFPYRCWGMPWKLSFTEEMQLQNPFRSWRVPLEDIEAVGFIDRSVKVGGIVPLYEIPAGTQLLLHVWYSGGKLAIVKVAPQDVDAVVEFLRTSGLEDRYGGRISDSVTIDKP